jgi:4-alpha-glucanotransferase
MVLMNQNRQSGILCHLTSLPTAYGIGDFGPVAYEFIDELAKAGQSCWQILPVGNTDDSGCPYATDSAFGCADYYISPDLLAAEYELDIREFNKYFLNTDRVDFGSAKHNKQEILAMAYAKFSPHKNYKQFLSQEKTWIEDYCTFRALCETRGFQWHEWGTIQLSAQEKERVKFHKFCQYNCFSQLAKLKKYANDKNIKLIGDLPIFVSYNSMDVWKNPRQFFLNTNLEMEYEAGAAPDAFSKTGQKWGTPLYDWNFQKQNNYEWWNERLSFLKRYFDVIRIDHFRGFCATWISKVSDKDATGGHWYPGPGENLFLNLHDSPEIIAEDLGHITPDVDQLRNQFNFPGMRVFQFLLGDSDNPHKLYNYVVNSVAYSGTHDCDTLLGWFQALSLAEQEQVEREIKIQKPNHWDMLKILMETPSKVVLIQVQDLLGLGTEGRFNYPGTVQNLNWTWKMKQVELKEIPWGRLSDLARDSGRAKKREICG